MAKTFSSPEQRSHTGSLNVCQCVWVRGREKREGERDRKSLCAHMTVLIKVVCTQAQQFQVGSFSSV